MAVTAQAPDPPAALLGAAEQREDEHTAQQRVSEASNQFLRRFAAIWLFAAVVLLLAQALTTPATTYSGWVMLAGAAVAWVAFYRNHIHLARAMIVLPLALLPVVMPFFINGVRSPILGAMSLMVLLAGWIYGRRAMLGLTLLYILSTTLYVLAEHQGWFQMPVPLRTPQYWWQTWVFTGSFSCLVAWYLMASFEAVHVREAGLLRKLEQVNGELTQALTLRTEQLQRSGESLARVQTDYEQAYPMAMVAAVVPAVAHDLDTPVANAQLAAGALREQLRVLQQQLVAGLVQRSAIDAHVRQLSEGLHIIERANARVGELVSNLKQLSIDQATQRRRSFALDPLIDEVLMVLSPTLRKTNIKVVRDVAPGLTLDSYPGPMAQVLVNLVQNALLHAFDGRDHGTVTLSARPLDQGWVRLTVQDDGAGMPDAVKARLFEPFFTTRAERGGSGLGLSFSRQLVQDSLGGRMAVESTVGLGSQFYVDVPRVAPLQQGQEGSPRQ